MPADAHVLRRLPSGIQQACLTFDDGPDPEYTPRVLDILAAAGARATFYVVGMAAVRHAPLVRRMLKEGHEVANHTWGHLHPWRIRACTAREEVASVTRALEEITGQRPRYFRPPFGRLRRCMLEAAQEMDQQVVLWSLSGKDWGPFGRAAAIARRIARTRAGEIILLHDARWRYNRPWAMLEVLPGFLARLDEDGIKLGLLGRDSPSEPLSPQSGAPALP